MTQLHNTKKRGKHNWKLTKPCRRLPTRWTETQVRAVWSLCRRRIWANRSQAATTTTSRRDPRSASDLIFFGVWSDFFRPIRYFVAQQFNDLTKSGITLLSFPNSLGPCKGHLQHQPKAHWPLKSGAAIGQITLSLLGSDTLTLIVLVCSGQAAALDCPEAIS